MRVTAASRGRYKAYEGIAMEYTFLLGLAQGTLPPAQDY
ncbi:Protease 2 [Pantoea agglomerans]|uniref:Protease 2 n=1 Tax=Enterobacter agglomerans TaxID=549 RepID=A0A379AFQ9_ENTAG|nr:Protease 2 [Pantoea agglomerans]